MARFANKHVIFLFISCKWVNGKKFFGIPHQSTRSGTYASTLNDFAKGIACAKTGDYTQAEKHLNQLKEKQKDSILRKRFAPHRSSPYECSVVAENILIANLTFHQKKIQ